MICLLMDNYENIRHINNPTKSYELSINVITFTTILTVTHSSTISFQGAIRAHCYIIKHIYVYHYHRLLFMCVIFLIWTKQCIIVEIVEILLSYHCFREDCMIPFKIYMYIFYFQNMSIVDIFWHLILFILIYTRWGLQYLLHHI